MFGLDGGLLSKSLSELHNQSSMGYNQVDQDETSLASQLYLHIQI